MLSSSEYPPTPINSLIAKVLSYTQYAILIIMFFGDFIFTQLKITPPPIYHQMKEKRFMVVMIVMLLGNNIYNMLMSTGAFEVYIDNSIVFSKLTTGRMPTPQEIEALLM